jgi:hypothetical protein
MNRFIKTRRAASAAAFALALIGCQAIENEEAQNTEQLLSASGFHMRRATTPEQVANIEAMTQRKIVIHQQNGEPRYVYADAEDCRCVYVGDEENYDEFQKLSVRQEIAEDNADAAMDWGVWGPW